MICESAYLRIFSTTAHQLLIGSQNTSFQTKLDQPNVVSAIVELLDSSIVRRSPRGLFSVITLNHNL